MRFLLPFALLASLSAAAQRGIDTTRYATGGIETVSWYRTVPVDSLSRSERFMRGLTDGKGPDSVVMIDSMHLFDLNGRRAETIPRMEAARQEIFARRERMRRESIRPGVHSLQVVGLDTRLIGRVGEVLTDSLRVYYYGEGVRQVSVSTRGPLLPTLDSLSFTKRSAALPLIVVPRAGVRKGVLLLSSNEADEPLETPVSVWGYHLRSDDFGAVADGVPPLDWQAGRELVLRAPGNQKLLTIRKDGSEDRVVPVNQELQTLLTADWPVGEVTLVLSDLGTGEERYRRLRIW
ncbi:hypothetical protein [Lewinella sp. IMCC34183]|uniref:hypothetical protein n=1 Tax=Lewinella sp. IMCC34183 TaxID=2248762 RepID=UPI000E26F57A|nr:hypothetical protein [Lewinella sp. IMCC34183]